VKRGIALAALALLAACSGEEPAPDAPADPVAAAPTPAASPAAAAPLTQVPAAFLGKWDYVDGQCARGSDAQLTIEPSRLTFYESSGEVTAVRQPYRDTLVVTMAMSGEGDTWTEETTYRLLDGGSVLESNFAAAEGGEPFRRKRCADFVDVPLE